MLRDEILDRVKKIICEDRQDTHGDALDNFTMTAKLWGTYLGTDITAADVGAMLALLKLARMKSAPCYNCDNVDDAIGYLALTGEILSHESKG